jgi:hypothetical protein
VNEAKQYSSIEEAIGALKDQLYQLHVATHGDMCDYTSGVRYGYGVATALVDGHLSRVARNAAPPAASFDSVENDARQALRKYISEIEADEERARDAGVSFSHVRKALSDYVDQEITFYRLVEIMRRSVIHLSKSQPAAPVVDERAVVEANSVLSGALRNMGLYGNEDEVDGITRAMLTAALAQPPAPAAAAPAEVGSAAARDVLAERRRQDAAEGYHAAHDDDHEGGELANVAAYYALTPERREHLRREHITERSFLPDGWEWKPKDRRRDLVRAGALILAEIERLDRGRYAPPTASEGGR